MEKLIQFFKKYRNEAILGMLMLLVFNVAAFANGEVKKEKNPALKFWETTPDGIRFKNWEVSAAGIKVNASAAKIRKSIRAYTSMEGVVSALSLPTGSRLGFGFMVRINNTDYILAFGPENNKEFKQLHDLKVNDKIMLKSHFVSRAPKYAYAIINCDYVAVRGKIIYKKVPQKGGC